MLGKTPVCRSVPWGDKYLTSASRTGLTGVPKSFTYFLFAWYFRKYCFQVSCRCCVRTLRSRPRTKYFLACTSWPSGPSPAILLLTAVLHIAVLMGLLHGLA